MKGRAFAALMAVGMVAAGMIVFSATPAMAPSREWTSDADFAGGTFSTAHVVGTGPAASIVLNSTPTYKWLPMEPPSFPPALEAAAMTFDERDDLILAFGGRDATGAFTNGTWAYSVPGNTWTDITPTASPPPRWKAGFSYDSIAQTAILYGGEDAGGWRSDLWRLFLANHTWQPLDPPPPVPQAPHGTRMVYDTAARKHILVAKNVTANRLETWAYDAAANAWENRNPGGFILPATVGHSLAYDEGVHRAILFGGLSGSTVYGDVFEYDYAMNTWTDTVPFNLNRTPDKRTDHAMAYWPGGTGSLLYGGVDNTSRYLPWTWNYLATPSPFWLLAGSTDPGPRRYNAMATDSAWDSVIMFGGRLGDGNLTNETLKWAQGGYDRGSYTSATFDSGTDAPRWRALWWNATTPAKTSVRFQLATSVSPSGPWSFVGPDGTPASFYASPGQAIWVGHNVPPQRYLEWRAYLSTNDPRVTPSLDDVSITYDTIGPPVPYIVSITPPSNLTNPIVIVFNEPMDTPTVTWSITPFVALTPSWSANNTTLSLSPSPAFAPCTTYTFGITGGRDVYGDPLAPGPSPNPITWRTPCPNPYIVSTSPADGETNVSLSAPITLTFSKPMALLSLMWSITPPVTLTPSWDPTDTNLTLTHSLFDACTVYRVQVNGTDLGGNPLVPGPVPNPWSFSTVCPNPYIVSTGPGDRATDVRLDAPIVITFSEPMQPTSLTYSTSPAHSYLASWDPTNTVLTLNHTAPFVQCAPYTAEVTRGWSAHGAPLVTGAAPNPWSFNTTCIGGAPAGLAVSEAALDVLLVWRPVAWATRYNVYASGDRLATFPAGWNLIGSPAGTSFLAPGHDTDARTHYYLVRATDGTNEGGNSTMGVKTVLSFGHDPSRTNVAWFSLPYNSTYKKASDIAAALGTAKIDLVGKWDPADQASVVYYHARGGWRGTDFAVEGGEGLYLGTTAAFTWVIVGTDANLTLSFTANSPPATNVNWIGVPYTGVYGRASDIANALGPSRVTEVGVWDPATQSTVRWYWTGSAWTGTDFAIAPGAGMYLVVASDFTWTPALVTPAVP